MHKGITAVFALVAVGSCSPWPGLQNSDAGFSGGTRVEDRSGNLGSECGASVSCNVGLTCLGSAPGGLCTKACTSDADCAGASCQLAADGQQYCFLTCSSDQQCRDQYACLSNGSVSVCAPGTSQPDASVPPLIDAGTGFEDGFQLLAVSL